MKIVLVVGRFPQRSETFIYRKAVALARRGHDVTVLCRQQGDWALYPDALPDTLRVECLPPELSRRDLVGASSSLVRSMTATLHDRDRASAVFGQLHAHPNGARMYARHAPFFGLDADVVHFEFLGLASMYPLAAMASGAPTIASCRGQDVHLLAISSDQKRAPMLASLRDSRGLHCVSNELARCVERLVGRTERVWVNRPAVDVHAIVPRPPKSRVGPVRILASGRLVWVKGYDYLLTAFAKLAAAGVDFTASIAGDGDLYSQLRFSIQDLGLVERVRLLGGIASTEVMAELAETDIFVLSSVEEGISNSVLEAMAHGVPVVTTRAGGMEEAVTDDVEGLVVPIRDASALALALARLARDQPLRERLGIAARDRAVRDFTLERQVSVFEEMYRAVASSP